MMGNRKQNRCNFNLSGKDTEMHMPGQVGHQIELLGLTQQFFVPYNEKHFSFSHNIFNKKTYKKIIFKTSTLVIW